MFRNIKKALRKPPLYTVSETAFWDDDYISAQMLQAHLNPEFEGASRKLAFIEQSAEWIHELVPPIAYPALLDIGCGPGIYAEKFAGMGYQVTGVDFSRRSIDFARDSAGNQGLDINYLYQDYLNLDLDKSFDFTTLIYCDYGALSAADRHTVMENVYRHLKPGGKFLLDVFSMAKYNEFQEKQTWEICNNDGFWRPGEYTALVGNYKYTDRVTLEQIAVFSDSGTEVYYLWYSYFTRENLIEEACRAGFKVCEIFGDVTGKPYAEDSLTIAILLEK